ncbi:MAG: DUF4159 domain-containing protein, partial [Planctomycetota bacterium]
PVWFTDVPVDATDIGPDYWLYGVQACCRTAIFYSPNCLCCRWELADPNGRRKPKSEIVADQLIASLRLGQNLLSYATGRQLDEKLNTRTVLRAAADPIPDRAIIRIGSLAIDAGGEDVKRALPNMTTLLRNQLPVRIGAAKSLVGIDEKQLKAYPIIWVHGRRGFTLTPQQRELLSSHLERGGVLICNAICGSETFTTSLRKELALILPDARLSPMRGDHPAFKDTSGGFDIRSVTIRRPVRTPRGIDLQQRRGAPQIEVADVEGVASVFLSPLDLSCALESQNSVQCPGYDTTDAAKIAVNLILYAMQQ